jgi:alpha-1,2-mannosyltransferase
MKVQAYFLFSVLFTVAQVINHIDDTDETYGYYEPLHYLLYGRGMQTWEYGPDFAIRSYAFLMPFYAIASVFKLFGLNKVVVFFLLRAVIGQITAASLSRFLAAVKNAFGERVYYYMVVLSLCCPGLFYCSTSFLPSALSCSIVMLAAADYLDGQHAWTVFWGCAAVLWTGWPFVGVIFLPIGLHILYLRFAKSVGSVVQIVIQGALLLLAVAGAVAAVDSYMYGKKTFPPLNILLYNALSGNGDELYGVEPASYYVKNLLLTLGLSIPMAGVGVLVAVYRMAFLPSAIVYRSEELVLLASAVAWIGLIMSRPHKVSY